MQYEVKELSLGGILDQAIRLLRDHAGLLFGIVGVSVVPFSTLAMFIQQPHLERFQAAQLESGGAVDPELLATFMLWNSGLTVISLVIMSLANAAMIHGIASSYLSRPTTIGECFQRGLSRLLPVLGTTILVFLATFAGFLLLIIPGIFCIYWFMLSQHVTVLESQAGIGAMKRSKALVKGNMGTLFLLTLVLGILGAAIGGIAGMIPQPHVRIVIQAVVQGVATVIGGCALVVFYFSCRCQKENFDLDVLATAVEDSSPVAEDAMEYDRDTRP